MLISRAGSQPDHPLRVIRDVVNATLSAMSAEFDALYSPFGRELIPPERLLRALLLQAFYTIRSERQLVEREIEFDLLFRWFVGLGVDDPVWDATSFTKNRDRLLAGEIASLFLATVLARPKVKALLSSEHFSVTARCWKPGPAPRAFDRGTVPGPPPDAGRNEQDFHGQTRSNDTHASTTDGDARLYKKGQGKEAKLCFMGHALMENRSYSIVGAVATRASGHAERLAAQHLIEPHAERTQRITLAADKGYDTQDFVAEMREINVTPHVAQNDNGRRSAIDDRTTRHPGYVVSLRIRKRIEEAFGWAKTVAGLRKARHRGLPKIDWQFTFAMAAYNLVRLPRSAGGCGMTPELCSLGRRSRNRRDSGCGRPGRTVQSSPKRQTHTRQALISAAC